MSCNHPNFALDLGYKENGKKRIKFLPYRADYSIEYLRDRYGSLLLELPCGKCYGCISDYKKAWSARIVMESKFHEECCFITLTYDDAHLPDRLEKRPLQLFLKRLRKYFFGVSIRYFACGELGEGKGERSEGNPHYHAILFGVDFPDKVLLKRSSSGQFIYRSPILEHLWPYGMSSIGEVTASSAAYVAGYSMKKKMNSVDSGEFVMMSTKPGIGYQAYSTDIYETDRVYGAFGGKNRTKVPRYFDKLSEKTFTIEYEAAKFARSEKAKCPQSSMLLLNLPAEEVAHRLAEDFAIFHDCLKVRSL